MKKIILGLIITLCIAYSCTNTKTKKATEQKTQTDQQVKKRSPRKRTSPKQKIYADILSSFPATHAIKGKTWTFNKYNFFVDCWDLVYSNGKLIIIDPDNHYCFKYINIENKDTIIPFGKRGKEPLEVNQCGQIININNDSVSLWDLQRQMIFNYVFSKIEKGEKLASSYKLVRSKNFTFDHIFPIDKNRYIVNSTNMLDAALAIYNKTDGTTQKIVNYPYASLYKNSIKALPLIMQATLSKHKNYIVSAYFHTPLFRIFYVNSKSVKLQKEVRTEDIPKIKPIIAGEMISYSPKYDNVYGFMQPYLADQYFIIPYSGRKPKDYPRSYKSLYSNTLLVYDWKANPLFVLTLDEDCSGITYDEEHKILYTIARNDESEPHIREYHIDVENLIQKNNEK